MRKKKKFSVFTMLNYLLLGLCGVTMVYPFWYIFMYSLSTYSDVIGKGAILWPQGFTLSAIKTILSDSYFMNAYGNTLFVVGVGTVLSLAATALIAYPLACKVGGHRVFSFLIYFTMLFGGGMIPTYYVVRATKLINTLWSLILPSLITPFNVFIMRNFFQGIPESLIESANIDGAGSFCSFFKIVIPLSMPIIATVLLFYAVGYWNAFFNALLYIRPANLRPLQLVLREMVTQSMTDTVGAGASIDAGYGAITGQTIKMAAVTVSVVPIACVYPFLQKYFTQGVLVGAVKS